MRRDRHRNALTVRLDRTLAGAALFRTPAQIMRRKKSPGHPIAGTLNPCPDIAAATGQNGNNLKEFDPF